MCVCVCAQANTLREKLTYSQVEVLNHKEQLEQAYAEKSEMDVYVNGLAAKLEDRLAGLGRELEIANSAREEVQNEVEIRNLKVLWQAWFFY